MQSSYLFLKKLVFMRVPKTLVTLEIRRTERYRGFESLLFLHWPMFYMGFLVSGALENPAVVRSGLQIERIYLLQLLANKCRRM